MPTPKSDVLKLAKQGNPKAISILINCQLQPKGITAKVSKDENGLSIFLEGKGKLDKEDLTTFIQAGLEKLKVENLEKFRICKKDSRNERYEWQVFLHLPNLIDQNLQSKKHLESKLSTRMNKNKTNKILRKSLSKKEKSNLLAQLNKLSDPSDAISFLCRVIGEFPCECEFYFKRANKYSSIRELEKALLDYEEALELDPHYTEAKIHKSIIFLFTERYQDAKLGFDECIAEIDNAKKPRWNRLKKRMFKVLALSYRAIAETHIGNYAEAHNDLDAAIKLKPYPGVLKKIKKIEVNVLSNLGKESLDPLVERVHLFPEADEMVNAFLIRLLSLVGVSLCVIIGINSHLRGSDSLSPSSSSSPPSSSPYPTTEEYEGSALQQENINAYGRDRYKRLEACQLQKIAENAPIEETARDCNLSNF